MTEILDYTSEVTDRLSDCIPVILLPCVNETTPCFTVRNPTLKFTLRFAPLLAETANCAINSVSIAVTVVSSVKHTFAIELGLKGMIVVRRTFSKSF
jgi:hypothetical protein